MSEREIIALLGVITVLGGLITLVIQFTVHSTFKNLQGQINELREFANRQNDEIVNLRARVDEWQAKYYKLHGEYTASKMKYDQLQQDFDRMRQG